MSHFADLWLDDVPSIIIPSLCFLLRSMGVHRRWKGVSRRLILFFVVYRKCSYIRRGPEDFTSESNKTYHGVVKFQGSSVFCRTWVFSPSRRSCGRFVTFTATFVLNHLPVAHLLPNSTFCFFYLLFRTFYLLLFSGSFAFLALMHAWACDQKNSSILFHGL